MIKNGLTKKINPNTNIFTSVINAVQTLKSCLRDVTMKRQISCAKEDASINNIVLRAVQMQ
jgi:hypothetical protein